MVGKFCWVELLTSDVEAAAAFYGEVVGWTAAPTGGPRGYRMFSIGGVGSAGLMTLPEDAKAMGARPSWFGYVSTPDVDAEAALIQAAGGALYREPETIPGMGRFAVVADPQGGAFGLWTDLSGVVRPDIPPMTPGHVGWYELFAGDVDAAMTFYSERFGWIKAQTLDMGEAGPYQMFSTEGTQVGGIMRKPAILPQSFWNYYHTVPALDAALAKVEAGGGKIVHDPMVVSGGAWIAQCFDPQGAFFSLVARQR
jgi:predicted enzyme related to lactoylglutathione lyase